MSRLQINSSVGIVVVEHLRFLGNLTCVGYTPPLTLAEWLDTWDVVVDVPLRKPPEPSIPAGAVAGLLDQFPWAKQYT